MKPTPVQDRFNRTTRTNAILHLKPGEGKTTALVYTALKDIHDPHYRAIIFGTVAVLKKTVELMNDLGRWNTREGAFTFPVGSKLYLHRRETKGHEYGGAMFQFIGYDGIESCNEHLFEFMRTRLRNHGKHLASTEFRIRATTGRMVPEVWYYKHFQSHAERFVP